MIRRSVATGSVSSPRTSENGEVPVPLLKRKDSAQPPPTSNRFDRWDSGAVYDVLETSVGNAGPLMLAYRGLPEQREQALAMLEIELRQAHDAVQSLRNRL
jgi:hypothetical protein